VSLCNTEIEQFRQLQVGFAKLRIDPAHKHRHLPLCIVQPFRKCLSPDALSPARVRFAPAANVLTPPPRLGGTAQ
jgi:hypothetical protein